MTRNYTLHTEFDLRGSDLLRHMDVKMSVPEWLAPHKNNWLSKASLCKLITCAQRSFVVWFDSVEPRLTSRRGLGRNGKPAKLYLVKHVWAAAQAWSMSLFPLKRKESDDVITLRHELAQANREVLRLKWHAARQKTQPRLHAVHTQDSQDEQISREIVAALTRASEPRPRPGIYFLHDTEGQLLYIGQAGNVLSRMIGHTDKPFDSVRMIEIEDHRKRLEIERALIRHLKPPFNVQHTA